MNSHSPRPGRATRWLLSALLAAPLALAPLPARAQLSFLAPDEPDASVLLAPPPAPESAEQAADLDEVRAVYRAASEADKQTARSEKEFSVFNFAQAVGPYFLPGNLPRTAAFFEKVQQDTDAVTGLAKAYFHRPRPYAVDTNLIQGKLEKSFSYPSGHSTKSMVLALVLADLVPDKRDAILAHARLIGWHRVQIARHYATDIYAGRVLAQAIVRELKKSAAFEQEVARAKAEIQAVRHAANN